jgi:spermidine synthase
MAFALMPTLGMRRSLLVLALTNALVAVWALLLARRAVIATETPKVPRDTGEGEGPVLTAGRVRVALVLILVEGFLAFALEIAWTRYFTVVLGSSTYSFSLVLAAFLSGIALGSAWLSRAQEALGRPLRVFGWTQVLAGLAVLAPLGLYPWGPWLMLNTGALFSSDPAAFYLFGALQLLLCYLVMLPPTMLIGMALPLLVKGLGRDLARLGSDSGRVYAWNTWGNVAGALLAGLVLLPALGMERLLHGAALGSAVLGLASLALFTHLRDRAFWLRLGAAALVLGAVSHAVGPWRTEGFALHSARRATTTSSLQEARARLSSYRTELFEDDPAALLMVYATEGLRGHELLTLTVNGKPDASSHTDLPTQVLSGHLPLLLAPQPGEVLVVGLASGITAGAVLAHPVSRLDVVDIVSAMPRATRLFGPWNREPLADPRLHLIVDDARGYLSQTRARYDVIISEPSNPWMAGTGALFSREHYARAARALAPDGVYLQWLQTYELADETFAAVVRTFREAFPHVYAFQGNAEDLLMLGSRRPLAPDWSEVRQRFDVPAVREDLGRLRIGSLASLLAFQRLSPSSVDYIAARTTLENTDDNLFLEYRAPRDLFARAHVSLVSSLDERLCGGSALLLGELLRRQPGSVQPRSLLGTLSDSRIQVDAVREALELASYGVDATAEELFPLLPPADAATFARRVAALVREGRGRHASQLVDSRAAGMLLQAALVPERAAFWDQATREWLAAPVPPPALRRVRVELLMASGRGDEAAREILAWMEEIPGPDPTWLVLRACEIDRGALCDTAVGDAAARSREPVLGRLQVLRADSRSAAPPRRP